MEAGEIEDPLLVALEDSLSDADWRVYRTSDCVQALRYEPDFVRVRVINGSSGYRGDLWTTNIEGDPPALMTLRDDPSAAISVLLRQKRWIDQVVARLQGRTSITRNVLHSEWDAWHIAPDTADPDSVLVSPFTSHYRRKLVKFSCDEAGAIEAARFMLDSSGTAT